MRERRLAWFKSAGILSAAVLMLSGSRAFAGLISYYNLDESSGTTAIDTANLYGGTGGQNGTFSATGVTRVTPGLVGSGAAVFDHSVTGASIDTGTAFAASSGITIEAMIKPTWSGTASPDYAEIYRKEDGNTRILFSFQNDTNNGGSQPANPTYMGPVLSLGLNIGGAYNELDMPLDGDSGRPTLAQLKDGNRHYVVGTYNASTGVKAIYVDGTLTYSTTVSGNITSGGTATGTIGNVSTGASGSEPFSGTLDEVALWDSGLDASTIAAHYANVQAGGNYFAAPEPGSLAVIGVAALGLLRRRRTQALCID